MRIAINAGHAPNGNPDPGACNASTGLRESDVTYSISRKVEYYLGQVGYDVMVIQDDSLQAICDLSDNYGADLFISIHCNSSANSSAKGTETFCLDPISESGKLAIKVQSQLISTLDTVDRGVKTDRFYVLRNTSCPAILVECAFISNEEDEALLSTDEGQDRIAQAIARGVTDYGSIG